eukprot:2012868-Lingulodinium_polyedra.AAC.1
MVDTWDIGTHGTDNTMQINLFACSSKYLQTRFALGTFGATPLCESLRTNPQINTTTAPETLADYVRERAAGDRANINNNFCDVWLGGVPPSSSSTPTFLVPARSLPALRMSTET